MAELSSVGTCILLPSFWTQELPSALLAALGGSYSTAYFTLYCNLGARLLQTGSTFCLLEAPTPMQPW